MAIWSLGLTLVNEYDKAVKEIEYLKYFCLLFNK